MRPFFVCFFVLLLSTYCSAYQQSIVMRDTLEAHKTFLLGDSLMKNGKFEGAISAYQIAGPVYQEEMFWLRYLDVQTKLVTALWQTYQLEKTTKISNHALSVIQEQLLNDKDRDVYSAKFLNALGIVDFLNGEYDKGLKNFLKTLEITKRIAGDMDLKLVTVYNNLGIIYIQKGRNKTALKYLLLAEEILENKVEITDPDLATCYMTIGIVYAGVGSLSVSLEYFRKALDVHVAGYGEMHPTNARYYSGMGEVYLEKKDLDMALLYHNKSLDIDKEYLGLKHPNVADDYHNIGMVYTRRKQYTEALQWYRKALFVYEQINLKNHLQTAKTYGGIADVYMSKGEYDSTILFLNYALDIRLKMQGAQHPFVIHLYNELGKAYLDAGDLSKSKKSIDLAANLNKMDTLQLGLNKNLSTDNVLDKPLLVSTLRLKAEFLYKSRQTPDSAFADEMLEIYTMCDLLIGEIRSSHLKYSDKVAFGETAMEVYKSAVKVCFEQYERSQHAIYLQKAFNFIQKAKSSVLAENLNDQFAKQFSGVDEELIRIEEAFKVDLSYYQTKINEVRTQNSGLDTTQMRYFESLIFSASRSLDSVRKSIEAGYPDYFALKHKRDNISIEQVQKNLKDQELFLEYFDTDTLIYVFGIGKEHLNIDVIEADSNFRQDVLYLSKRSSKGNSLAGKSTLSQYKTAAHAIYQKLLEPMLSSFDHEAKSLIIAPSARLQTLPWEILIEDKTGTDYSQLNYVLRNYATSYTYSASLSFSQRNNVRSKSGTLLAFAPSYEESNLPANINQVYRDELVPLKWNQSEVDAVNSLFEGKVFVGASATESQFKEHAKDYQVIHLAMHALVNHEEPMRSKLVFAQDKDSIEDGMLHTYELFNMSIPAEMVVLSACNTGLGKLEEGEGVTSLARAFSYAGCPSVVMSQWNVNDASTAKLMTYFYEYLADGDEKHIALQQAKLDFLKGANEVEADPFYWGSFVVVGDVSPLKKPKHFTWLVGGLLLLFFLALVFFKKRKV